MIPLSSDESLHFELLQVLSAARYHGADVAEVLEAAGRVDEANLESFHDAFFSLAQRVQTRANTIDASRHPVSARDAYFRAATYYRAADFYLHENPSDPRINDLERITLQASEFDIPAIFYAAEAGDPSTPRPTLIAGNGYDGSQEELLHFVGFAALERGYNFVTYEGPGQPTVRRKQNLGFIHEWEKVLTPVVDHLMTVPSVDASKIALLGVSMGGYFAVRAAAFEHRLAATLANDGIYSVYEAYRGAMPPPMQQLLDSEDKEKVDAMIKRALSRDDSSVKMRWGIGHGLWCFNVDSPWEWMEETKKMTIEGLADKVQCPVWVGEAADDQFFRGQPGKVRDALGDKATLAVLTSEDAAGNHCHVGAQVLCNQVMFDWLDDLPTKAG